jgi:hypothetical protein
MNETGGREPNRDEHDKELREADRVACLQHVKVLQNVGYVHETQNAQETQANPVAVEIDAHKRGRYGKKVDNGEYVEPEP